MRSSHWGALLLFLASLSTLISGLDHWKDAVQPSFIGGAIAMLCSVLVAAGAKPLDPTSATGQAVAAVKAQFAAPPPKPPSGGA